jgi:sugar phosphate isomerase/epimerase
MTSRRDFLTTVAAGLAAPAVASMRAGALSGSAQAPQPPKAPPAPPAPQAPQPPYEIKVAFPGVVGLQLWSLREYLPKDLAGTLAKVRAMGFQDVEGAGLWKHTAPELRAALDAAGLRCKSAHMGYERLRDDPRGAFAEAKTMGASGVVCAWIPPGKDFTREAALKSAEVFNHVGKAARAEGLTFAYHCHGYEFVPSDSSSPGGTSNKGTMFDTLAGATDPSLVTFQIDVFHAFLAGADPAALIDRYKSRVTSLHLKDLKRGFPVKAGTALAPPEADVPLGTGQVDMSTTLRMALKSGVSMFFIEDESADPIGHVPLSLGWLERFRP